MAKTETPPTPKVLCVWRASRPGFRDYDFEILQSTFPTVLFNFTYHPLTPLRLWRQIRQHDLIYIWFAGLPGVLSVLFGRRLGKKTALVTGGYDIAKVPEIGYGLRLNPIMRRLAAYTLRRADLVLPISHYSEKELLEFVTPQRREVIPCCCKTQAPAQIGERKNQVITIGLMQKSSSARKGHWEFIEVARRRPEVSFILVGKAADSTGAALKAKAPANVQFVGFLSGQDYARTLAESKVYLQLSRHEGFGVAVMEAMQQGCTPVVSRAGALPEVVGEAGIVVDSTVPEVVAEAVDRALQGTFPNMAAVTRAEEFSCERRAAKLIPRLRKLLTAGD